MRNLSEETRQKILNETAELLRSRDFSAITTSCISKAAGISESTLFRYFPQKQLIFIELLQSHSKVFFAGIEQLNILISSPEERILAMGNFICQFSPEGPDILLIFTREVFFERESAELILPVLQKVVSFYQRNIAEGMQTGLFRNDIEPALAAGLFLNPLQDIIGTNKQKKRDTVVKSHKIILELLKKRNNP